MTTSSSLQQFRKHRYRTDFVDNLPGDDKTAQFPRQVLNSCFSSIQPQKFSSPHLVAFSEELASDFGLNAQDCMSEEFLQLFSGQQTSSVMKPYSMCYGGHQFGNWAGQLGDGRAINLGEFTHNNGQAWTFQLKGAGMTPYSRHADGLAVLRSSTREYLCSEAMHHLGIPTTRALCLIGTGENVTRDMFYDGNPVEEPGAIVCRSAPSFIRFGNFEIHAARGEFETLRKLADFTIDHYFPSISTISPGRYIELFEAVCDLTRNMILQWMRVGFVHGVMNTDNMSILGLTIDYGPYGWLENYDPDWTPNTTDAQHRRYRFKHQPRIALWNLAQLANALYPLIKEAAPFEAALENFHNQYQHDFYRMMTDKLGLDNFQPSEDEQLVDSLTTLLANCDTDMTLFFRNLAYLPATQSFDEDSSIPEILDAAFYSMPHQQQLQELFHWLNRYQQRRQKNQSDEKQRIDTMNRVNPLYVLRNYLAQLAIDKAEKGDFQLIEELQQTLQHPYTEQEGKQHLCEKRPEWAKSRPGCSMLSCSS